MHKLKSARRLVRLSFFCLSLSFGSILSLSGAVLGQTPEHRKGNEQAIQTTPVLKEMLPRNLGGAWQAVGPEQLLDPEQWSVLPDAEVYAEYGLQRLISRVYQNGTRRITIEAFEMKFPSGAYGLFTFNRGLLSPNRQEFYLGRYLISMAAEPAAVQAGENQTAAIEPALIESLKVIIPNDDGRLPMLPSHLPQENRILESERYIIGPAALARSKRFSDLKELVNFDGGVEIVIADYHNGGGKANLIIVEYHTPQSSTDGYAKIGKYVESFNQSEKEKRILKRIGNYVVQVINVSDRAAAEKIVSQIKYDPKVYWEGRKLSDIPLGFRQPDPTAVEEASKTIKLFIRSFYWIGTLLVSSVLLGFIFGAALFYWKRYRRRKLGIDDLFGDTGETVRLHLDDYLLQTEEPTIKQLGDGKNS